MASKSPTSIPPLPPKQKKAPPAAIQPSKSILRTPTTPKSTPASAASTIRSPKIPTVANQRSPTSPPITKPPYKPLFPALTKPPAPTTHPAPKSDLVQAAKARAAASLASLAAKREALHLASSAQSSPREQIIDYPLSSLSRSTATTTPKTPLPNPREVIVDSSTQLFRLLLDLWSLVKLIIGVPVQILIWAWETAKEVLGACWGLVIRVLNFVYAVVDWIAGGVAEYVDWGVKGVWGAIVALFDCWPLVIFKRLHSAVVNEVSRSWRELKVNRTLGETFKFLVLLAPVILGLSVAWGSVVDGNLSRILDKGLFEGILPAEFFGAGTHLNPFDRLAYVATNLKDVAGDHGEVLALSSESSLLHGLFSKAYNDALAAGNGELKVINKGVTSNLAELMKSLDNLSYTKINSFSSVRAIEKVRSELRRLDQSGISHFDKSNRAENDAFREILEDAIDNQVSHSKTLEHRIAGDIILIQSWKNSLPELRQAVDDNYKNALFLQEKAWNSSRNRVRRRRDLASATEAYEVIQRKEKDNFYEALATFKRFQSALERSETSLGSQFETLRRGLSEKGALEDGKRLFKGKVRSKMRVIDALVASISVAKRQSEKALLAK